MANEASLGKKIFRGTIIIVAVSIAAKLASFLTEAVLAYYLGTSAEGDAYYMISSLHHVVYPMMSVGIWKVFLPAYKKRMAQGDMDGAAAIANKVLTFFTLLSVVIVLGIILFGSGIVSLIAPGFEGDTRALCIRLIRLSAPMYIFIVASAVYASMLQCHNRFLGSQIREVASHVPTILAALLCYRVFGIEALAYALVVGGVVRLLVELPFVNWNYRPKLDLQFRSEEFRTILRRLPSALLSEGANQINTLIDKIMASGLPQGSISALNYGAKLTHVFSGLFSSAIATALYPQVIELIARGRVEELKKLIRKILSIFLLVMLPISIGCILLRRELVTVVYMRGAFDAGSVSVTASVFACYAAGLLFMACSTIINNLFYSYGDTKTPLLISLANMAVNVAMNFLLISRFGVSGLAAATTVSSVSTLVIRMILVRKHVNLEYRRMLEVTLKVLAATLAGCVLPVVLVQRFMDGSLLRLLVSVGVSVPCYLLLLRVLHVEELHEALTVLKNIRKKSKS